MKILELFRRPKRSTAQLAKERLQIIVSHESARKTGPDIVRKLQRELLEVISKYVHIDQEKIKVQLERHGDQSVLELNVTLPDGGLVNLSDPESQDDDASAPKAKESNASDEETLAQSENEESKKGGSKEKDSSPAVEQA